jgi:hypothetical protein
MEKYFWPHTSMLLLILIPRAIMFAFTVWSGVTGKVFGGPGTAWIRPIVFLIILVSLGVMTTVYFTNEKDLRKHPLIYCWSLN